MFQFLLAATALAAPFVKQIQGFGPDIPTHSVQSLNYFGSSRPITLVEAEEAAKHYLTLDSFKNNDDFGLKVTSMYQSSSDLFHVYAVQLYQGLEVVNGVGNVNLLPNGDLLSGSHSFYQTKSGLKTSNLNQNQLEPMEPHRALESFLAYLGISEYFKITYMDGKLIAHARGKEYKVPHSLKYLQTESGLRLCYDLELDLGDNWFNAQVDAVSGKTLQNVDWVSEATFNVFKWGINDPSEGTRQVLVNPEHLESSPLGWNTFQNKKGPKVNTETKGNNVYAQENPEGENEWRNNYRPDGGKELNFDFPLDLKKDPKTYIDATITNLFYLNNMIHDIFYQYGFDEKSGNFQEYNFGKGGLGNDAVIANAQDGSGTNNANFATPPDGQHGRMRMYVWTATSPSRDGDLEAGIVIHEYAHGISTRLTGGPANSGCLGWGEAGGMGEGWGDYFATIFRMTANNTRQDNFNMGGYSSGDKKGIRNYIYSTSLQTNPSTYAFINKPGYWGVHAKGEVWAAILYEMYWNLVDKHGYDPDWYNLQKGGNKIALQIVVDGLKLQPCRPSFVDARDAIILADEVLYDGANYCEIFTAFAKRGLGLKAERAGREDFTLPAKCKSGLQFSIV